MPLQDIYIPKYQKIYKKIYSFRVPHPTPALMGVQFGMENSTQDFSFTSNLSTIGAACRPMGRKRPNQPRNNKQVKENGAVKDNIQCQRHWMAGCWLLSSPKALDIHL